MYAYDQDDRAWVHARVDEFADQVQRRLSGELTEEGFRPLRLMNGLYLQLHGYMLRVAIPYGTLSSLQLRALASIARDYDRGYGHFTTRQNIQFNWPKLTDVPAILRRLADVDMHAIQSSGNCIRNVTADPFAGAAADELEDPRIVGELLRQWSSFHPEFSFLPRKFKIAVSGAEEDRAAVAVHDVGIRVRRGEEGGLGYEIWAGGGQGRTPVLASRVRAFLRREELLSYLDALLRVYNRHGRRDNKYKARIKILLKDLGVETFVREVEAEWARVKQETPELSVGSSTWARIERHFRQGPSPQPPMPDSEQPALPGFERWLRRNTHAHRVDGRRIVTLSLKPVGGIPGDARAEQMDAVAALADRYSEGEIRVSYRQNLVLPHVPEQDLAALFVELEPLGLSTANQGLLSDIIACPGLDYCNLANARSIPVAQRVAEHLADREDEVGELSVHISGCINACAHHHTGNIGILGIDKRGEEAYQIAVGGRAGDAPALARIVGPAVAADEVPEVLERLLDTYVARRNPGEDFITTLERIGLAPMKEAFHAAPVA